MAVMPPPVDFREFFSHIYEDGSEKYWTTHIEEMERLIHSRSLSFSAPVQTLLRILIRGHDFGKLTSYFQKKLREDNKHTEDPKTHHALYSALWCAYRAQRAFGASEEEHLHFYALLAFNIALHHHGHFTYLDRALPKGMVPKKPTVESLKEQLSYSLPKKSQIEALFFQWEDQKKQESAITRTFLSLSSEEDVEEAEALRSFFESHDALVQTFYHLKSLQMKWNRLGEERKRSFFFLHQECYSVLVHVDIVSASRTEELETGHFSFQEVDEARKELLRRKNESFASLPPTPLHVMRTELLAHIMERIREMVKKPGIYTLTAPCGTGKTVTGFCAAALIRELVQEHRGGKIVYVGPFTSIIDQNFEDIRGMLPISTASTEDTLLTEMRLISKVHHLSPYKSSADEEIEKEKMLLESWNSSVVITTFVQLFDVLMGWRKRPLKKLHALRGSIVIIDEIQGLPLKYWRLAGKLFQWFSDALQMTFVIMTATKPELLPAGEATELIEHPERFYQRLSRTRLIPMQKELFTPESFVEHHLLPQHNDGHHLVVVNTVKKSIEVYRELKRKGAKHVYYLSANLTPRDKLQRIAAIKERLSNRNDPIIVVSTQMIESGVDVDFDRVHRELAPLDAILQSAGRSDRHFYRGDGITYIFELTDTKTDKVYDSLLLSFTEKALREGCENIQRGNGKQTECLQEPASIPESSFLQLIQFYFEQVQRHKGDDYELFKRYIETMQHNKDNKGICEFRLIEEQQGRVNVLVLQHPLSDQEEPAQDLYKQYQSCLSHIQKEILWRKLQNYLVHVPQTTMDSLRKQGLAHWDEKHELYIIPSQAVDRCYDETGIRRI